ncbi:MAG: 16S rRNA (cytosine(1402)-N(4))-methyltransferase RsmH [Prevotella sp.]|nr:16S rRNA (cytosine(1402)-N(4))-methyltransferase RsmH [Prevotella sp.]MCM1075043.1 16S rRNA (cytosine(1402)-N(4))-methyltransferase RsmH [Ruminococcus sp.]
MSENVYHIPAMLSECLAGLDIKPGGTYVDATFGGGGHSRAIMEALGEEGRLFSFDQDMDAYSNRIADTRFTFVHSNFRYLANFMRYYEVGGVDGILADLGVSFHHFDTAERGFSFRADAPLDMRMNQSGNLTAREVLNTYSDEHLTSLLRTFGDLKRPSPIVKALLKARNLAPISTTGQLLEILTPVLNPKQQKKELAQVFQALRIEVNGEMQALADFLKATERVLHPGGRLVVLTYHSLEDRMVKNFMRSGNVEGIVEKDFYGRNLCQWTTIGKQPQAPTPEEIERNPRSRSARLRVAAFTPDDLTQAN